MPSNRLDNQQAYNEIAESISKISNRTFEMKKKNLQYMNKLGQEMNEIVSRAQEVVKACLAERQEFIKEVEQIQSEVFELNKKIDSSYSNFEPKSQSETATKEANGVGKTRLGLILSDSLEEEEEEESNEARLNSHRDNAKTTHNNDKQLSNDVCIPDTCDFEPLAAARPGQVFNSFDGDRRLFIRDTLDTNLDDFFNKNKENLNSKRPHFDETGCFNEEDEDAYVANGSRENEDLVEPCRADKKTLAKISSNNNLNSTPLAVKKKLHEHGLLDLTNNSGGANLIADESPLKQAPAPPQALGLKTPQKQCQKQNSSKTNSPIKYIQTKFSPLIESPLAKKSGDSIMSSAKTPIKLMITTPTKSPSIFYKKPKFLAKNEQKQTYEHENSSSSNLDSPAKQHDEREMDYSFEFREQVQKNSQNSKVLANLETNSLKANQNPNKRQSKSARNFQTPANRVKASASDYENSPKQGACGADSQSRVRRMKQLTMAQVFQTQTDKLPGQTSLISKTSSVNTNQNKVVDFDETCLPNDLILNQNNSGQIHLTGSNLKSIKDEPNDMTNFDRGEGYATSSSKKSSSTNNLDEFFQDFDKVPKKKANASPTFKHVQVVRKQDERKKLQTFICKECETYWNSVPEEMRPKRMEDSCRHRAKYVPPSTPEHYWSIAFPTTQECIQRGYGGVVLQNDKDDPAAKRPRRKRPLQLISTNEDKADMTDFDFG